MSTSGLITNEDPDILTVIIDQNKKYLNSQKKNDLEGHKPILGQCLSEYPNSEYSSRVLNSTVDYSKQPNTQLLEYSSTGVRNQLST